jgi:hypothetical protein
MPEGTLKPPRPLDAYLNDHLAGATGAAELARNSAQSHSGTPLSGFLNDLAAQIEQDRNSLQELMDRLGATKNPLKQAGAWLMEKVSRVKLTGTTGGEPELNALLTLETLSLGVEGKICLWEALKTVADSNPVLAGADLDGLLKRANDQRSALERERLAAAKAALSTSPAGVS